MPPNSAPQGNQPSPQPAQQQQGQQTPQPYDFIINPESPPRQRFSLPGGGSKLVKIAYIIGGLLLIFIFLSIVKGLLTSKPNLVPMITVVQDQQSMIHLAFNSTQERDLSTINKNFAGTAQLSLTTAQSELISYMVTQHQKVGKKTVNLKVSAATDSQLVTAGASGTYNQVFKGIMEDKLNGYMNDLKQAYSQIKGKKGRALLSKDYDQAQLLQQQLNTPAT